MSKRDRILPPGPNPREDLMTEKEQKKLREIMHASVSGGESGEEEIESADQAEGERSGDPAKKVKHTPDQAEGGRKEIEEEIRREEEKRHL